MKRAAATAAREREANGKVYRFNGVTFSVVSFSQWAKKLSDTRQEYWHFSFFFIITTTMLCYAIIIVIIMTIISETHFFVVVIFSPAKVDF
jgi:hypothetical protein